MKTSSLGLAGCFFFILGFLLCVIPMSFWTDRNLDFWLTYFKGETVDCPFWLSFIVTLFAPIGLFLNIVGEVARLCI